MSKEIGYFKGRVVEVSGTKITIDVKEETRAFKDKAGGTRVINSAFPKPQIPKIGAVARCHFHSRDMVEK
jgi:hypothetical protein